MNCIIIHGSNPKDIERVKEQGLPHQNKRNWIPWMKEKLEEKGIKTFNPLMPKNWGPKYEEWKREFEMLDVNKESVLVGHSAGAAFLVRWLGENPRKIKKLILIAPVKILVEPEYYLKNLYDFQINEKIKDRINSVIIFVSDNDAP